MSERVALTGATGFIGTNLLSAFAQAHIPIRALTRSPRKNAGGITWIGGDLENPSALHHLVNDCTAIIHCAGVVRGNSLEDFEHVNVKGTENLLNAVREKPVKPKLLLISSLAARHPQYSWYAKSKATAEELLMSAPYADIPRTIFRPTAVYGPGDKEMQPVFSLMRRGFLLAPKVKNARISLLHVHDLTCAIMAWTRHKKMSGIFEMDDGKKDGYKWGEIADIGEQVWRRPIRRLEVPVPVMNTVAHVNLLLARVFRYSAMFTPGKINEITHKDWVCDNTPLMDHLKWEPKIKLRDGIHEASLGGRLSDVKL